MDPLILKIRVEFVKGSTSEVLADEELDLNKPEGWRRLNEILGITKVKVREAGEQVGQ